MKNLSPLQLLAILSLPVMIAIRLCILFVDEKVALRIWGYTSSHPNIHSLVKEIWSPLPVLVVIATSALWLAYFSMQRTKGPDNQLRFIKLVATAIPSAFLIKTVLQYTFGRTDTRLWLQIGGPIRFLWFNTVAGSSFPSGHTVVITAFLTAAWLYFPRYRFIIAALFIALAAALLFTSYHFVSDIIAGGYCGILITIGMDHFLSKNSSAVP
jgi:membrane-associated phospholipid phosphatase